MNWDLSGQDLESQFRRILSAYKAAFFSAVEGVAESQQNPKVRCNGQERCLMAKGLSHRTRSHPYCCFFTCIAWSRQRIQVCLHSTKNDDPLSGVFSDTNLGNMQKISMLMWLGEILLPAWKPTWLEARPPSVPAPGVRKRKPRGKVSLRCVSLTLLESISSLHFQLLQPRVVADAVRVGRSQPFD